jgi:single-strand DNA-binding protein
MPQANINHVTITGNLTRDPELKETSSGTKVCELRVASNQPIKKDGKWETKANYFQVTAWGSLGENCDKYLSKGSPVAIAGRLDWQKWETAEGQTNSRVLIIAEQVQFLSGGPKKDQTKDTDDGKDEAKEDKGEGDDLPF